MQDDKRESETAGKTKLMPKRRRALNAIAQLRRTRLSLERGDAKDKAKNDQAVNRHHPSGASTTA